MFAYSVVTKTLKEISVAFLPAEQLVGCLSSCLLVFVGVLCAGVFARCRACA